RAHVAQHRQGASAKGRDLFRRGDHLGFGTAGGNDGDALLGQRQRNAFADALACASNDGDLAVERAHQAAARLSSATASPWPAASRQETNPLPCASATTSSMSRSALLVVAL